MAPGFCPSLWYSWSQSGPGALSNHRQVDVLMLSDLRFPGGTSHSVAEEIAAQAQVGWSTGLVHMNGPLLSRVKPVNALIRKHIGRGSATLFLGGGPIRAKVVVVRHPAVLEAAADQLPPIETQHTVLVANAAPTDIDGYRHYRPALVDRIARERFGVAPIWARSARWCVRLSLGRFPKDCVNTTG